MPIKKSKHISKKIPKKSEVSKFGDSYTSLILGIIVVIIATILLLAFLRGKNKVSNPGELSVTEIEKREKATSEESKDKTYKVAQGDTLWSIADRKYKSGYNWVDIAKANNLSNPDNLNVGMELVIPDVVPKTVADTPSILEGISTKQDIVPKGKISTDTYKVTTGDTLWDISVRAYGDGYKWDEIAKANNLSNPDLIYADSNLKIPSK